MTEREKMIEIIFKHRFCFPETDCDDCAYKDKRDEVFSCGPYKLADMLIEAEFRDITTRGWIFMNVEAIVPTPNIYNKVAELLDCPKISQEESND